MKAKLLRKLDFQACTANGVVRTSGEEGETVELGEFAEAIIARGCAAKPAAKRPLAKKPE